MARDQDWADRGLDLPQIKSYAKAFDAAVEGDKLLAKQTERAQKKATPAPATAPKAAAQPEQKKEPVAETPTARKQKQHEQIEQARA